MSKFMLAYHGGERPSSPEEGAAAMASWKAWAVGLGDALTEPGNPLGKSKTVSVAGVSDDGGANPLSGYSVVTAASMDAAVAMAQSCPFLEMNTATIEVAEIFEM